MEKQTARKAGADLAVADRNNIVYAGTAVTYGRGCAVVVATAMNTEFGQIAQSLQTVEAGRTPLQHNLDKVGRAKLEFRNEAAKHIEKASAGQFEARAEEKDGIVIARVIIRKTF